MGETAKKPLFRDIDGDDPDPEATVIESLCLNCGEDVCYAEVSFPSNF